VDAAFEKKKSFLAEIWNVHLLCQHRSFISSRFLNNFVEPSNRVSVLALMERVGKVKCEFWSLLH
jgi:hypothetical protein